MLRRGVEGVVGRGRSGGQGVGTSEGRKIYVIEDSLLEFGDHFIFS